MALLHITIPLPHGPQQHCVSIEVEKPPLPSVNPPALRTCFVSPLCAGGKAGCATGETMRAGIFEANRAPVEQVVDAGSAGNGGSIMEDTIAV
jgi:hypothetical protein